MTTKTEKPTIKAVLRGVSGKPPLAGGGRVGIPPLARARGPPRVRSFGSPAGRLEMFNRPAPGALCRKSGIPRASGFEAAMIVAYAQEFQLFPAWVAPKKRLQTSDLRLQFTG